MMATVKMIETNNNFYYLGFGKQSKLSLLQIRNKRYKTLRMAIQKLSGVILIIAGILAQEFSLLCVLALAGLMLMLAKDQIMNI